MELSDDAQLLSRSRAGDASAYAQLYERHVASALHVARQLSADEAEDVVSEAFIRIYTILRQGRGPDIAFRPYLMRAVRNAAIDRHRRVRNVTPQDSLEEAETPLHHEPVSGDPAIDQLEQQFVARAFQSLPERWRMVLWHTEVQGETPAQVAPLLGITPRAVAQLGVRAREGLRTAWLQQHIASAPPGHEEMVELLAAHIRGSLGLRARRALDAHLTECLDCRRLRDELTDVSGRLGVVLVPALLGLSAAELAWHTQGAAAAVTSPAAMPDSAARATDGGAGGAGVSAVPAAGVGTGSGAAKAAAGLGASTGGPTTVAGSAPSGGLIAATLGMLSQPVTVGLVAATITTTGVGAYVASVDRAAPPASPSTSQTTPVSPPSPSGAAPGDPGSPGSPAPGSPAPGSEGSSAGSATPALSSPPADDPTPTVGSPSGSASSSAGGLPTGSGGSSPTPSTSPGSTPGSTSSTSGSSPTSASSAPSQSPTSASSAPSQSPVGSGTPATTGSLPSATGAGVTSDPP